MHKLLEQAPPEIKLAFRDVIVEIAEEIDDDVRPQNFEALVRFAVEGWIEKNKPDSPVIYTQHMQQALFEIVRNVLLAAYKFDPEKLKPESSSCDITQ